MSNAQFEIVFLCHKLFMALPYPSYSFKSAIIMKTTLSIWSRKRLPVPIIGALKIIGEAKGSKVGWVCRNVFRGLHQCPSRQAIVSEPTGSKKPLLFLSVHGTKKWTLVCWPYISTTLLTAATAERLRNMVLAVFTALEAQEKGVDLQNLVCFQIIPPGRYLVHKSREANQKRKHRADFQGPMKWGQRDC